MDGMTFRPNLTIDAATTDATVRLELRGELDCSSAPKLRQRIRQALADGATAVELDLAGVPFIDASGVGVLAGTHRQLRGRGGQLQLRRVPRPVQRVFDIVGLTELPEVPVFEDRGSGREESRNLQAGAREAPTGRRRRSPGAGSTWAVWIATTVVLGVTLAACGSHLGTGGDGEPHGGGGRDAGVPAQGGPLTVPEALDSQAPGPLTVRGYLVASRGRAHLCELQAQSYPPQCGGRSMDLEGYDATSLAGTEEEGGVRWSTNHVVLVVERRAEGFFVVGP